MEMGKDGCMYELVCVCVSHLLKPLAGCQIEDACVYMLVCVTDSGLPVCVCVCVYMDL